MDEILTIEEMEARYPSEWVLLSDPQMDESHQLRAGRVLHHGPDQDEVCLKLRDYPRGHYALHFLGTIPDEPVLVL